MEYGAKSGRRYRRGSDYGIYEQRGRDGSIGTHRSLHSPQYGAKLGGDRSRIAGDVTHDYSNVLGWNLKGKKKGC